MPRRGLFDLVFRLHIRFDFRFVLALDPGSPPGRGPMGDRAAALALACAFVLRAARAVVL